MFVETVRAVQSLKLFNREIEREGQWLNRYADTVSANIRLGRARIAFTSLNESIFGLENIVTIYLAAKLALSNQLTVGMIFAFISYKQQFTEKAVLLVEKALDFRFSICISNGWAISRSARRSAVTTRRWVMHGRSAAGSSCAICVSATPRPNPSCWRTSTSPSRPAAS